MVDELVRGGEVKEKCPNYMLLQVENARLKEELSEMEKRANHDALTGLPNRRHFVDSLEQRIMRCQRYGDNTALLFLDIDDLKVINGTHGHEAGDMLLVHLARILQSNIRVCDMVARTGGDEFALLLDNLDADEVERKILALIERIKTTQLLHEGRILEFGAAIGYNFVGPADTVSALMSRADEATYQSGKDEI